VRPPRKSRWRRHRRDQAEHQVEADATVSDKEVATAAEVEELRNEIAELRREADELRYRLKESEARLGTIEDASDERARIIDTLLEWCQEQETVLGKHRDVVAAMGAAARLVEEDLFAGELDPLRPPPPAPPVD
jgi:chromosome segregation ATPase